MFLLHQLTRDALRSLADRCIGSRREDESATDLDQQKHRLSYNLRMLTKYLIEAVCYPLLLVSSRVTIYHGDPQGTWPRIRYWCREEGIGSLFGGLTPHLFGSVFEEVLSLGIDHCTRGFQLEPSDVILLKTSGVALGSVFTTPIHNVSVIQRCQSSIPGLVGIMPLRNIVRALPWKAAVMQFFCVLWYCCSELEGNSVKE